MVKRLNNRAAKKFQRDSAQVAKEFWPKLRSVFHRLPFLDNLLAAYYCATDKNAPLQVRAVLMGALAYFILPIDILPDFILALGFTDDATVLLAAIKTVRDNITPEHRAKAARTLQELQSDP